MKYVVDKEIDLREKDLLNSKSYAETLKNAISNAPLNNSFTIGLFGEWGIGKSSIVETTRKELESDKSRKIKFITYDAWKYANDSFRRMFLLKIQKSLRFDKTNLMNSFYLNESEDVNIKNKLSPIKMLVIVTILLVGLIIINTIPWKVDDFKLSFSVFISFLGLLAAIFFKVFDEFKVNIQKSHLFAPEQFEECFVEMTSKSLKNYSFIEKARSWVGGNRFEKDIDKLIIVIDNIDRCNKELAYELLTDTKSFLGQTKDIVFLIPVDDDALKQHIINSNSCNKEAEEFLRKFFNVTIRIKPLKSIELFDFANNINIANGLDFNPDTVDIVSREYATNPRRVIQFFNNLQSELFNLSNNISPQFSKDNESLICKILIIREEWSDFYKLICFNSENLDGTSEEKSELLKNNPELGAFLENTVAISKRVNLSIIDNLIFNGKNFSELPKNMLDKFNKSDLHSIGAYLKRKKYDKNLLLKYLIEELRKGVNSRRYKTHALKYFNLIILINDIEQFDVYENRRIQNVIDNKLEKFVPAVEYFWLLVQYTQQLYKQGILYLPIYIVNLLETEFTKDNDNDEFNDFAIDLIKSFVAGINDEELLKKVKKPFTSFFINQEEQLTSLIRKEKVEPIVTSKIFDFILTKIQKIDSEDPAYEDILFIADNKAFTNSENEAFFERINAISPNFTNYNHQQILDILNEVIPVLSKLDMRNQNEKPHFDSFFSKIFANRSMSNRNVNFLTEVINNPDATQDIINFLFWTYHVTLNNTDTSQYFNQIASSNENNRALVNDALIGLKNDFGYSLIPLYDVIISDKNYDKETFELLRFVFSSKDSESGDFRLEYEKLNNKIKEMSNYIFEEKHKSKLITEFFEKIVNIPPVRESLSDIISSQSKDRILLLSTKLQHLAFDKITEGDTLFDYEDNIELLNAISESGEKRHKIKLANVIVRKMPKQDTLDDAFTILEHSTGFNKRDTSKIAKLLEEHSDNVDLSDRVSNIISHLKSHAH